MIIIDSIGCNMKEDSLVVIQLTLIIAKIEVVVAVVLLILVI